MTDEQEAPITLSREDLFELVWSKPMRDLAKDFGISDVALAKRCKRLGIPVPGRGYWARLDAGQTPHRPILPHREPEWLDQQALTVAPSASVQSAAVTPSSTDDQAWLKERWAFEERPDSQIEVPATIKKWDPAIQSYRAELEQAAEEMRESRKANDRYEKWPERRKRTESHMNTWKWRSAKDRGQRLRDTHKSVAFRVSLNTYRRALHLTNTLALAAANRGFSVHRDDEAGRIAFAGYNANIHLYVTELLEDKTRPHTRYDGKIEQEKYKMPTGRLRLTLHTGHQSGPTYEDRDSQALESQLNHVFMGIYRLVVKSWQRERQQAEYHRRWEEQEKQRAEAERLRIAREQALARERKRRRMLSVEASRWAQATRIREYVSHIHTAAHERGVTAELLGTWAEWALQVATELDPTEARARARWDGSEK